MAVISSAGGLLAQLDEDLPALKVHALKNLNLVVDQFWAEISANISVIESLYEDEQFAQRQLAALLASKVFYHLGELNDSVQYALGAGELFDAGEESEYAQTLVAKCVDEYVELCTRAAESPSGDAPVIDPRLVAIFERMLDKCVADGEYRQAIGMALESRRLDKLEEAILKSPDVADHLAYTMEVALAHGSRRDFRQQVLLLMVRLYEQSSQPDFVRICQCLMFLDDPASVARILEQLLKGTPEDLLLAYQVAFDLFENEFQQFLLNVRDALPDPQAPRGTGGATEPPESSPGAATAAGEAGEEGAPADALSDGPKGEATVAETEVARTGFEPQGGATSAGAAGAGGAEADGGSSAMETDEPSNPPVTPAHDGERIEASTATADATPRTPDGAAVAAVEVPNAPEPSNSSLPESSPSAAGSYQRQPHFPASSMGEGEAVLSPEEVQYSERLTKLKGILSGETPINLTLQFLYSHNHSDLHTLKNMKQAVDARNSVCHSATIYSNALMHAGTTVDTFLRENLEWLSRATNWAKFSATAGLGVIHRGHLQQGRSLMAPYLPQNGGGSGSPFSEGGALYALGLIHANHGEGIQHFLLESLRNTSNEVIQHGACLGLGLAALGTADEEVYEDVKSVLYTDSAVAGEAAGIAMGLLLVGTASERAGEMLAYAHDTQHEKIIRGLALGIALVVYGREEEADTLIEQMSRDQDPILRYGGMYALGMAYRGTANSGAIRQLLHFAVSDVSDDVRRAAVLCLGFVLCSKPEQTPRIVSLLSESYNPHVRYGAALAVGISCASTGLSDAVDVLEPLTSDSVDFVRQGALIAMAMVLMQCTEEQEPRVGAFRRNLDKLIADKHEDTVCKMGAILAYGILDAGGRNVSISLRSKMGHDRITAVVGMAVFTQFWSWYPLVYFISLAFTPTAFIGLQKDLQMPKFDIVSDCRPSLFAYPPPTSAKVSTQATKVPTAILSTAGRARNSKAKKELSEGKGKEKEKAVASEVPEEAMKEEGAGSKGESKATEGKDASASEKKEGSKVGAAGGSSSEASPPAPTSERLRNPARVLPAQRKFLSIPPDSRYRPLGDAARQSGFVLLQDTRPGEVEEMVARDAPDGSGADTADAGTPTAAASAAEAAGGPSVGGGPSRMEEDEGEEPAPPEAFEFHPGGSPSGAPPS
eukprot:TRINITY_DN16971_c0_g1_i1.p1 TRINITY_DN16971_c0_g1~~TRINITY_DN16971_c0_g1_i1.p1  ORF type:complete len:1168 (-),score=279.75 TRINITY_DN16971_c0_g1_i1:370-3873(-)